MNANCRHCRFDIINRRSLPIEIRGMRCEIVHIRGHEWFIERRQINDWAISDHSSNASLQVVVLLSAGQIRIGIVSSHEGKIGSGRYAEESDFLRFNSKLGGIGDHEVNSILNIINAVWK